MEKQFEVKEKSLNEFFKKYVPDYINQTQREYDPLYYQYFREENEIFIIKSNNIEIGTKVVFKFEDSLIKTRNNYIIHHTYNVVEYDNILNKLVFDKRIIIEL